MKLSSWPRLSLTSNILHLTWSKKKNTNRNIVGYDKPLKALRKLRWKAWNKLSFFFFFRSLYCLKRLLPVMRWMKNSLIDTRPILVQMPYQISLHGENIPTLGWAKIALSQYSSALKPSPLYLCSIQNHSTISKSQNYKGICIKVAQHNQGKFYSGRTRCGGINLSSKI